MVFEFGVDPNLDPELALKKRRQEAKAAEVSTTSNSNQEAESSTMAIDQTIGGGSTDKAELSTIINTENQVCSIDLGKQGGEEEKEGDKDTDDVHMEELTEDEQMARALQMSMQGDGESNVKITTDDYNVMQDPEFMSELLQSLPGVDPNDPQIRNALQVIAHLTTQRNAIKMLHTRIKLLHKYLVNSKNDPSTVDHDILRQIAGLCNRLPTIDGSDFNQEFLT
ncbi:10885_t:CDS:2, partial [Entrophospora sp. SA101]